MTLSTLDITHKCNHRISGLSCLASLSYHNLIKVHTYCSIYQHFISSYGEMYSIMLRDIWVITISFAYYGIILIQIFVSNFFVIMF